MAHGDINHLEIPVSDFARGSAFYGEVFGWQIREQEGFEGYPMWMAPNGTSGGALVDTDSATSPRSIVEVDSIDNTLKAIEAAGGTIKVPKTSITDTSWWASFVDPDGNELGLFEGSM